MASTGGQHNNRAYKPRAARGPGDVLPVGLADTGRQQQVAWPEPWRVRELSRAARAALRRVVATYH
jgi:hypothetical protein